MTMNPFFSQPGSQSLLAPQGKESTFRWATVTTTSPFSIMFDGDTDPLASVPDSLIPAPPLGARVWCQLYGRRVIILGRGYSL